MNNFSPFDRLASAVDYLIDDHVGIIRSVQELRRQAGSPSFFHFYAYASNTSAFCAQSNFQNAGGASSERSIALAKAVGEAVERYCAAIYERDDFPLVSFAKAPFQCVPPEEFALYSLSQYSQANFPYVPFKKKTPVRWVAMVDPNVNEFWYVPAAFVVLPYSFDEDNGEQPIAQRISTGLACHSNFARAAISGICEVIERDAFAITWQARLAAPQIRIESLSEQNRDLVQRFERVGDSVVLLNITMDVGIPTILSVLRGKSPEAPALVFAASADLDPEKAVRKSLEELAHTRMLARQLHCTQPLLSADPLYDNIRDKEAHVRLYCNHANAHLADFIFSSEKSVDFSEIKNLGTGDDEKDLNVLVSKVSALNHRVLLADLTTDDISGLGLRVVRAVIPGFHPLFMGHRLRALGGSRLWQVPQKLGYAGISPYAGDNPAPHPYP